MTKEERLKWLEQIESDICVCSLDSTFADDAKSCAIRSAIDELEQHRWIPVTERLPEEYGEYYVTIQYFVTKYKDVTTICYDNESKKWMDCIGFKVIAWMPLPKQYEGSE